MVTSVTRSHELLYRSARVTPLGRVTLAGKIQNGLGVEPAWPLRVYGSYGFTFITRGEGQYRDSTGREKRMQAGDLVLVFPDHPHTYNPLPGTTWDEIYVVFGGPIFDVWRTQGIITPERPILRLGEPQKWKERLNLLFENLRESPELTQVTRFVATLGEIVSEADQVVSTSGSEWLAEARKRLESNLEQTISASTVASDLNLGYETFRKAFTQAAGTSPGQYRLRHRMAAAAELLLYTTLSLAQIATRLGFADEFAFAKRFKAQMKMPPGEFRRRGHREADRREADG
jgi:AraC-like DNA-binding protein